MNHDIFHRLALTQTFRYGWGDTLYILGGSLQSAYTPQGRSSGDKRGVHREGLAASTGEFAPDFVRIGEYILQHSNAKIFQKSVFLYWAFDTEPESREWLRYARPIMKRSGVESCSPSQSGNTEAWNIVLLRLLSSKLRIGKKRTLKGDSLHSLDLPTIIQKKKTPAA